ncbi:MAG: hypothetical protein ACHQVK_00975, partial [Candidatus Paceibacterales bacterium]
MEYNELVSEISQDIKTSKKYGSIYGKTIERIVADYAARYKKPVDVEKKSKNLLHQIWGAFYATRPSFGKILETLKNIQEESSIN